MQDDVELFNESFKIEGMKYTPKTFRYALSDSEKEQDDLIALCELLGMRPYSKHVFEFSYCPWLLIDGRGTYQRCSTGAETIPSLNIKASDFITSNF